MSTAWNQCNLRAALSLQAACHQPPAMMLRRLHHPSCSLICLMSHESSDKNTDKYCLHTVVYILRLSRSKQRDDVINTTR